MVLDPDPHWIRIFGDPGPDPQLKIQLEIQNGKYKIIIFFIFSKRKHKHFKNIFDFCFILVKMLEKKCMKFFKYFFTLKKSGLGSGSISGSASIFRSGSVSGSASVFKTLDPDP